MNGIARDEAPFSGRVWQEIDRTVHVVRSANCTARRFLDIDGPYGLGLTSVVGEEGWLPPTGYGAAPLAWGVTRAADRYLDDDPGGVCGGTYLVRSPSRPVPLIASGFYLDIRAVEAYEAGC